MNDLIHSLQYNFRSIHTGQINFMAVLGLILIFLIIALILKRLLKDYHSNWNTLIDDFNFSTDEFYSLLETEMRSSNIGHLNFEHKKLHEGSFLSPRRKYLRIGWKEYQYDLCAAPFGRGFFISWWLLYQNSVGKWLLTRIPFIGPYLAAKLYPITYYKIDTASMFMTFAQHAVLNVIDQITKDKGVRALTEDEKKPIMKDIFRR